jgi:hypothetical protein
MPRYSQVFLILALFCFLFPFVVISPAKNAGVLQMTGWEMLTTQDIGVSKQPPLILHVPQRIPVLLALLCGGLAIVVRFAKREEVRWVVTVGSIAAAVSLLTMTTSGLPVELSDGQSLVYRFDHPAVQFLPGFYVALALLGAAAVASMLSPRKQPLALVSAGIASPVISPPLPEPVEASSFCIKCGHGLAAGAKFCNRCGATVPLPIAKPVAPQVPIEKPVSAVIATSKVAAAAPVAQVQSAIHVPALPKTAQATVAAVPAVTPKRRLSLAAKFAMAAAGVVVAVAVWYGVRPGADSASVAPTTVTVSPSYSRVAPGGVVQLQASVNGGSNRDVNWQIEEGSSGGSIESGGAVVRNGEVFLLATYKAPAQPGTYHVMAVSAADQSRKGIAQVIVEAWPQFRY